MTHVPPKATVHEQLQSVFEILKFHRDGIIRGKYDKASLGG